ncbi:putative protein kinase RLK-Pelle-RLCK-VIIa-2 family [Helianthus annuus]|nr:putative protein kinase RLK-Pelle-RLCK-VIIa-2 family [Helianthus annuus]
MLQVENFEYMMIPHEDILLATNNFDKVCLIGSGGYGEVYKAELKIKSKNKLGETLNTVAIKRIFSRKDEQGKEGFLTELDVLTCCEHPNVVSLVGFCVEESEWILVYEHASNGSLNAYLGSIDNKIYLTWAQCLKICIDIAKGLNYLHTNMEDKRMILHRDIKSDNILLGKNWEAKIADFGLSKFHPTNQHASTINTNNVAGTDFYLDPEYLRTGKLKKASDIYSLGVVLFEIFSGKLAYDSSFITENEKGLAPIARIHFEKGTLKGLLDPRLIKNAYELGFSRKVGPDHESLDAFSRIAYKCLAKTQGERPRIDVVIEELEKSLYIQVSQCLEIRSS